jgi:ubiquinone biosynthesis protein
MRKSSLHLGRYGEILAVLIRYGFGDIIAALNIEKYTAITNRFIPRRKKVSLPAKVTRWERIRLALDELGPTFIKFGQFMSNRPDLLPAELIVELEKLQDSTKPFASHEIRTIIEADLKRPIEELFAEFSISPIASASISQVHKARLANGMEVAVKVRRPRIKQAVETDVEILRNLVSLIERHYEKARALHLQQLVDEFHNMIEKELDFQVEASHIERFRINFKDCTEIRIPQVVSEYSTKRVLVTEFIHGIKVTEVKAIREANLDAREVAAKGAKLILRQIFEHGFFHADPHPGNILVTADGTICFLDFGAVGIIPPSMRRHLSIMLYGVVQKDPQRIIKSLGQIAHHPVREPELLEYGIMELIEEYMLVQLKDINVGEVLRRFANLIITHELKLIPGFYMMLKSLTTIEAVGGRLDPEFNIAVAAAPFVKKLLAEHPPLRTLPFEAYFTLLEMGTLLKDLPYDLKDILHIVKTGELQVKFEHRGLTPLMLKADQLVNRLVFALVLAALIIGSSVVVLSGIPPKLHGVPLFGIVGFLMAGVIGFGLLFDIARRKRM